MALQTGAIWAATACAAVVVVGAAGVYWTNPSYLGLGPKPARVSASAATNAIAAKPVTLQSPAPKTEGSKPPASRSDAPAFDVVDVEPSGEAVIAGRAAPNAKVTLRDAGKTLVEATADSTGQFVMIPSPLRPGEHSLSLAAQSGGESASSDAISVSVPMSETRSAALVLGNPASEAPHPPPGAAKSQPTPTMSGSVVVKSVEATPGGKLFATGAASPNATVRLYLSGAYVGDAKAREDGRWTLTILRGLTAGTYEVRADEINPATAAVVARAETPFDYPASAAEAAVGADGSATSASPADLVVDFVQTHHVERGHTLWGISQKFYGDGSRYELIFAANSGQIRNPNLIYPGQMFVVPKTPPKP